MKKIFLYSKFVAISFVIVSCGIIINPINAERITSNNVELNREYVKEIGNPLVVKGDLQQRDAVRITQIDAFKINNVPFPYRNGDVLPLLGENKTWLFFYDKSAGLQYQIGIAKNKSSGEFKPFFNSSTNGFVAKSIQDLEVKNELVIPDDCNYCFKQEFVFNGRVGDNLKFLYREYSSDFIRADFSQELQYDISESNIVGFKGLRLSILETTNTKIMYKVLSTFD